MKTIGTASFLLVSLALLVISACRDDKRSPTTPSFSTPTGTGHLRKSETLWILNLEGNYADMGRQYGALLKDELRNLFSQMDAAIGFNRPEIQGMLRAVPAPVPAVTGRFH